MPLKRLWHCSEQETKRPEKRKVTVRPYGCPQDNVVLYVVQSDSCITRHMQRGSVKIVRTKTSWQNRTERIEKSNIRLLSPAGPYVLNVHLEEDLHDAASSICIPNFHIKILIGVKSNTLLTSAGLRNMRASSYLINNGFLPLAW